MALQGQARNPRTQAKPLISTVSVLGFRARGQSPRHGMIAPPAFFSTLLAAHQSRDGSAGRLPRRQSGYAAERGVAAFRNAHLADLNLYEDKSLLLDGT